MNKVMPTTAEQVVVAMLPLCVFNATFPFSAWISLGQSCFLKDGFVIKQMFPFFFCAECDMQ